MAKKVIGFIKLQILAGQANPAPPVGPALGQHGVNIMEFCKAFNAKTQDQPCKLVPAEITVYADRSFTFITKTPPTSSLILEATKLKKGSSEPHKDKVGAISMDKIKEIAEIKISESNAIDLESVIKMVKGTARSMGINVEK